MKNLKKILLSLMVLFLAFAFIGCPAEPDPVKPETPVKPKPETPVVTNNFEGKTFIGMEGEGEDAEFASYIIFTSDKDCEVCFYGKTIPATYTVTDDVATLTGTGEYAELQLSTTKLTNGTFDITIPPAVSKEEKDIVVSYAVGTLWTIFYDIPDSDKDFSLKMPEEYLEYYVQQFKLVDGDYTKDDAEKTITLKASGWEKVSNDPDDEENGGGNTETPETPVVTNNFMGKTFLGMTGEGEDEYFASYIIFTSDKDCEVMFFDEEPMPATYTVADDVVTLTGTGEYAELQLSTTKLTDGTFEITIPPAVSQQENDIVVYYAVGTLWTILYEDSEEYFSLKMPEEELEYYVQQFGLVDGDYTKDDATKTITLKASGWAKVGGGSEEEESTIYYTFYNGHELDRTFSDLEDFKSFASVVVEPALIEETDYTIDEENRRIILTDSGFEKMQGRTLVVKYNNVEIDYEFYSWKELEIFATEHNLIQETDYIIDDVKWVITLTDAGAEKLGMGGDTDGGDSGEVYFYMYNGKPIGGKNTLEDFQYDDVKMYDLVEGTDYNIDHKNKYINFTDSGVEKLGMGGGSDDETWTVLDPEGNPLKTFESIEAANAFASSIGLVQYVDFDIDPDNQTITLTAEGLAKVSAGA